MAKEDIVIVKMINGANYIGRGYHFKLDDTAEMTKAQAKPFLKIMAGEKKMFTILDPDLDDVETEPEVPVVDETKPPEGKKIVRDPRTFTDPKELRAWLKEHEITVAGNPSFETMKTLIPENLSDILGLTEPEAGGDTTSEDSDEDKIDV